MVFISLSTVLAKDGKVYYLVSVCVCVCGIYMFLYLIAGARGYDKLGHESNQSEYVPRVVDALLGKMIVQISVAR